MAKTKAPEDHLAMRSVAERIERQRVAINDDDEKVMLKPWEVDLVVRALMVTSTLKHALGELSRGAGPGEWPPQAE